MDKDCLQDLFDFKLRTHPPFLRASQRTTDPLGNMALK